MSYQVSKQSYVDEIAEIKAAGYVHIIDNRPDEEVPEELQGDAIETAAKAAGLVAPTTSMVSSWLPHERAASTMWR